MWQKLNKFKLYVVDVFIGTRNIAAISVCNRLRLHVFNFVRQYDYERLYAALEQ